MSAIFQLCDFDMNRPLPTRYNSECKAWPLKFPGFCLFLCLFICLIRGGPPIFVHLRTDPESKMSAGYGKCELAPRNKFVCKLHWDIVYFLLHKQLLSERHSLWHDRPNMKQLDINVSPPANMYPRIVQTDRQTDRQTESELCISTGGLNKNKGHTSQLSLLTRVREP